ncbi:MAG: sugar phosphate isomerase/epimerase family protein [Eubacteriales bacterium]
MRLAINLSPKMEMYSYPDVFSLFSSVGFEYADFMLNDLTHDESPMCIDGWREYAGEVRTTAEKFGLKIVQTHAPFQFKNWDDPEHFENIIFARTVRSLEISAILGAEVCVVHGLQYIPYDENAEKLFDMNMDFYRRLLPYAEEFGVKIGVENLWQRDKRRKCIVRSVCGYTDEFIRYIDTLSSPYIVACVDVGHAGLVPGGDEAQDMIRKLGARVGALHIHDNDYQGDLHMMPYFGKMDWNEITNALAEINYNGVFTYEVGDSLFTCSDSSFHKLGAKIMYDVGVHLTELIESKRRA